jgi:plastocyanin
MRGPGRERVSSQRMLVACCVMLGLSACGREPAQPSGTVLVAMADNSFSPQIVRIPVGGSVLFHNAGRSDHNALAVDHSWSTEKTFGSERMRPDDMTEIVFRAPGVYPFYCSYHATPDGKAGMVGVIVVGDASYTPPTPSGGVRAAVTAATGTTRHVPQDYPTIQNAVDAADPGDLVLIAPGVYREEVFVTTPSVTLRGADRNSVILDGNFSAGTGVMVGADGVAIENMTARNYTLNGFFWTGVQGFRGSYLTAYNNGDYGIYAFGATDGVFEHSYASGSPDSAFYVGQCNPCHVVVDDVEGAYSGLGYSGTNSGGEMYVVRSRFVHNRSGIAVTTFDIELDPPGRETAIIGNTVTDSGLAGEASGFYATETLAGTGIALAGTVGDRVERNYVARSRANGLIVLPLLDRHYWTSTNHVIRDNVVVDSGRADLVSGGLGTLHNCYEGNLYHTSLPWGLQVLNRCGRPHLPIASDLSASLTFFGAIAQVRMGQFTVQDYRTRPVPPAQPGLPGGADAPVVPAVHAFAAHPVDLAAIARPVPQSTM